MVTVRFRAVGKAFVSALALLFVAASSAQVPLAPRASREPVAGPSTTPPNTLRVDVPLVMIPVQVNDARGASVRGLDREDFQLFEDGAEQKITHFSREDAPLSVGFMLDSSSSMKNKMQRAVEAGAEFLRVSKTGMGRALSVSSKPIISTAEPQWRNIASSCRSSFRTIRDQVTAAWKSATRVNRPFLLGQ